MLLAVKGDVWIMRAPNVPGAFILQRSDSREECHVGYCSPSAAVELVLRPLNTGPVDRLPRAHIFHIRALCLRENIALASLPCACDRAKSVVCSCWLGVS